MTSTFRRDDRGRLRVAAPAVTFGDLVESAFGPVRRYGRSSVEVSIRLLETIASISASVHRTEDRDVLRRHAVSVARDAHAAQTNRVDRRRIRDSFEITSRALAVAGD
jgi:uncharacterized membrane protein